IALAEHHHFESVGEAITAGADIVPKVTTVRAYDPPRKVADTEEGESLRRRVAALEQLADAYEQGELLESSGKPH
ncbi:MAG TPA: fructose-bisphosphatase class III, partial [Pyrinomonadaceae bacterium]|nr:fructose-bisphosphatase class III [Pyrinomonadaceae bacterium]